MDVHPLLMQDDEEYRLLFGRYQAKQGEYHRAFDEDWPNKHEVEQELVQLGQQVAARWDRRGAEAA